MISNSGWLKYNIWEHSQQVADLYRRRCRLEEPEMTCAAQAAELLAPYCHVGDTILDVGCGSGYFFHSLKKRGLKAEYFGIDASPRLIAIGRQEMPAYGLSPDRLLNMRLEDLDGEVDHVICLNVLSNIDNFHRPLERLLQVAGKTLILRESITETGDYSYVRDKYLDTGVCLNVYVNSYPRAGLVSLMQQHNFTVEEVVDDRTGGKPEQVIDYPHYWTFFRALRKLR